MWKTLFIKKCLTHTQKLNIYPHSVLQEDTRKMDLFEMDDTKAYLNDNPILFVHTQRFMIKHFLIFKCHLRTPKRATTQQT